MKSIFKAWFRKKPEFRPKQVFAGHHGACNLILIAKDGDQEPLLQRLDNGEVVKSLLAEKCFKLFLPRIENIEEILDKPGAYILETAHIGGPLHSLRFTRIDIQKVVTRE